MGKWIRVTDQLPDDDITVLIHQPDSVCPVWIGFLDADKWRDLNGVLLTLPVTHWQHLPDPPEPEVADPEDTLP